jgi:hypothetical protein
MTGSIHTSSSGDPTSAGSEGNDRSAAGTRDVYVDFLRAFSLLIVVTWHWVFTIVIWRDDGPHASNPIGFTSGMWMLTWLFQVMPLFFYIGGYGHLRAWETASARGQRIWSFVGVRVKRLAVPALALLGVWVALGAVLIVVFDATWAAQAVTLVVSPLWFIGVYLMLVLLLPAALWLHRRYDATVLVVLGGAAMIVDVLRFDRGWDELGLVNMILVWGFCHQMGFFYDRIVAAHRRMDTNLLLVGLFALVGLVGSGLYPGSMVGVPGAETSNMAPPTVCILALVLFQAGVAELLRPWVTARLVRPRWARVNEVINRFSMPLFLFHTTGMALSRAVMYGVRGEVNEAREPSLEWWLMRPLSFIGPLLFTLPVIWLFGRRWTKPAPTPTSTETPASTTNATPTA